MRYRLIQRSSAVLSLVACALAVGACNPDGPAHIDAGDGHAATTVTTERLDSASEAADGWLTHGRTFAEARFSPLASIHADNVDRLGLVWSYDFPLRGGVEATPLMSEGVLYLSGPWSTVYALDARSGALRWRYDPEVPRLHGLMVCCGMVNRGVALYEGKVFVGTLDGRLVALHQDTGEPVWEAPTADPTMGYSITGAPRVVAGNVVIGNGGAEFGVRGYVSAYDADTGELVWRTYWDSFAYDPELDLLYVGVGNGSPWNRMIRSPDGGDHLFLASILALRPATGELVWYYLPDRSG